SGDNMRPPRAHALPEPASVDRLAGYAHVDPHCQSVATRLRAQATTAWDDAAAVQRLTDSGVRFRRGHGRISAQDEVAVDTPDGRIVLHAERGIVLNPGTRPTVPPIDGLADAPDWTNRDAGRVTELPESIIVLGAGPVGVEFAQVFARFGAATTPIEVADRVLSTSEPEAGNRIVEVFDAEGITVATAARAEAVSHHNNRFRVRLGSGTPSRPNDSWSPPEGAATWRLGNRDTRYGRHEKQHHGRRPPTRG